MPQVKLNSSPVIKARSPIWQRAFHFSLSAPAIVPSAPSMADHSEGHYPISVSVYGDPASALYAAVC
jgi:hypothetical protein